MDDHCEQFIGTYTLDGAMAVTTNIEISSRATRMEAGKKFSSKSEVSWREYCIITYLIDNERP